MECDICMHPFDFGDRRPKCLPCGHTFCLQCLRVRTRRCPIDDQVYRKAPDLLPDNFKLMGNFMRLNNPEESKETSRQTLENVKVLTDATIQTEDTKPLEPTSLLRFWCQECDADAKVTCMEEHTLCSLKAFRTRRCREAQGQLSALSAAEVALAELDGLLESATLDLEAELASCRDRLEGEKAILQDARRRLETALMAGSDVWEEAKQAAPEYILCREASRLLADLGPASTCSVVLGAEGGEAAGGGAVAAWRGSVRPGAAGAAGNALARLLLCRLLFQGGLQRDPEEAPQEKVASEQEEEQRKAREADEQRRKEQEEAQRMKEQEEQRRNEQEEQRRKEQEEQRRKEQEEQRRKEQEEQRRKEQEEREEEEERRVQALILEDAAAPRWTERSNLAKTELSVEEMASMMRVGSRVCRIGDWKIRHKIRPGKVVKKRDGVMHVRWPNADHLSEHAMGRDGEYSLGLCTSMKPYRKRKVGDLAVPGSLDLRNLCVPKDMRRMTELLYSGELAKVPSLVLSCQVSKTMSPWAERVLEQVQPHLELLGALYPSPCHLQIIKDMPRLRGLWLENCEAHSVLPTGLEELYLCSVTPEQMEQVSAMPLLRVLEVHCRLASPMPEMAFPRAVAPSGLRWLRSGLHPLRTALALARAHGATLEELELVAASEEPYGCPNLAEAIRRCGLRRLKRLVLLRESYEGFCQHDNPSCQRQKTDLWQMFIDCKLLVTVQCSICDNLKECCVVNLDD